MEKEPCLNCGSTNWIQAQFRDVEKKDGKKELGLTNCSECSRMTKPFYTDAAGNRVVVPANPQYSFALGTTMSSKRQLSEHLKRHNLIQQ